MEKLQDDQVLILGLIEYDYSQLENHNITGIILSVDSDTKCSDFYLSRNALPRDRNKMYKFIAVSGDTGTYKLNICYDAPFNNSTNPITEANVNKDGFSVLDVYREYTFGESKILDIGKISVQYTGGQIINNRIDYDYTIHTLFTDDTLALHAFKKTYPDLFHKYRNDISVVQSELEKCIADILLHESGEKKKLLTDFISAYPGKSERVFKDLNFENTETYRARIKALSIDELNDILNEHSPFF